jgi:hypothetical protein
MNSEKKKEIQSVPLSLLLLSLQSSHCSSLYNYLFLGTIKPGVPTFLFSCGWGEERLVLGFELRASYLLGRHLNHTSSTFCSGYFEAKVMLFAQDSLD